MSSEFQDWLIQDHISGKVSTTYYPNTDSDTENMNRELTEMLAGHEL